MTLRTAGFWASIRRQEVRLLAESLLLALDLLAFLPASLGLFSYHASLSVTRVFEAYMRSLAKKNGVKPEE